MEFFQNIDLMLILRCFIVGGLICVVGQILIDKTKLTPARILVIFVTAGALLGGLGIYKYVIDFAGSGATVPLTGFGANLAKGAIEEVGKSRTSWCFCWWCKSCKWWYCCSYILWIYCIFNCKTKNKETISRYNFYLLFLLKILL